MGIETSLTMHAVVKLVFNMILHVFFACNYMAIAKLALRSQLQFRGTPSFVKNKFPITSYSQT